ncbi:hypothetical protein LZ31DRAFT_319507 [Colletotrichum somersetense]|nr:hypothetical protein LZ31DRAFT_319507 [Colletotrichum somersetense]
MKRLGERSLSRVWRKPCYTKVASMPDLRRGETAPQENTGRLICRRVEIVDAGQTVIVPQAPNPFAPVRPLKRHITGVVRALFCSLSFWRRVPRPRDLPGRSMCDFRSYALASKIWEGHGCLAGGITGWASRGWTKWAKDLDTCGSSMIRWRDGWVRRV